MTAKESEPLEALPLSIVERMAQRMPGGFFIYEAKEPEKILYLNEEILDIFGCRDEAEFRAFTGGTFPGMIYPDDLAMIQSSIEEQIKNNKKNLDYVEYRIRRKDGKIRWVDDYGRLVKTKDFGCIYYVMMRDITEERATREERIRMEMELEREREMSALKSSFLFNISHDIRTPMNAIMGFTSLAKKHRRDEKRLTAYLDQVEESSHYLLALIDDLLEMSEIDSGQLVLRSEAADLREELKQAIAMFEPQAMEKRLKLTTDIDLPPTQVYVDALRFRRIMGNLLSNAVKFTPQGKISVTARQKSDSGTGYARYEFTVEDTGIGMSAAFQERMYGAFEREETSTKTGYIGTGLGLTITKRMLDLMGGTIKVQSQKGVGTTFTVELPLKLYGEWEPTSPAATAKKANESGESKGHRILLVEDIDVNRMLAEAILQEAGFAVESVPDGCDAVEAVKNKPPYYYDLVLMDIQMPVMNGYEATRAIRALKRPDTQKLPIIALSANARAADRAMSLDSGMDSHIAKPFDIAHLISTVNEYIEAAKN